MSGQKHVKKAQKAQNGQFCIFSNQEVFGQTVLPDRSILTRQKFVENVKVKNANGTFRVSFKQCAYIVILTVIIQKISNEHSFTHRVA